MQHSPPLRLPSITLTPGRSIRSSRATLTRGLSYGSQSFLESEDVKQALNQTQSALAAITVLKKVCNHYRHLLVSDFQA